MARPGGLQHPVQDHRRDLQGENETKATTKLGSLVDIDFLPIIGLGGEIDWGVQPYDPGTNGGIVGTVTYDTTRNEHTRRTP